MVWGSALGRARRFLRLLVAEPATAMRKLRVRWLVWRLTLRNRVPLGSVRGNGDVVVSVTSFGFRVGRVHLALESIARGSVRPGRMILWLDDQSVLDDLPPALRRLRRRGLEILPCPDYGPHKKQYPYACSEQRHHTPLATADDDVLYPRDWLAGLLAAHRESPDNVVGYRAHLVAVDDGHVRPYAEWTPRVGTSPSPRVFCTGVAGILYPAALLDHVRDEGTRFLEVCPRADDIWMHYLSVRHGHLQRQLQNNQRGFWPAPRTQRGTLFRDNVRLGGNDRQVSSTYGPDELAAMAGSTT